MSAIHWARLTIASDQVDDAERLRISTENRLRSLDQVKGLKDSPEAKALDAQLDMLKGVEKVAVLELKRAMRSHPLGEWCKSQLGVGEKTLARLLGVIGDPAMRYDPEAEKDVPRTLSQLRSYCGYGDAATQRRRKGHKANWNAEARTRLYLISVSCMKCRRSPYRKFYDAARKDWEDRDTTDLHKHNHALRCVSKALLKDLWLEAAA